VRTKITHPQQRRLRGVLMSLTQINNLFLLPRHRMTKTDYRAERARAFQTWHDVCGIQQAA